MNSIANNITIDGETDITLLSDSLWVTVGNVSVHVIKTDEGVVVDLYPLGHETDEVLASTYINFSEADMGEEEAEDDGLICGMKPGMYDTVEERELDRD